MKKALFFFIHILLFSLLFSKNIYASEQSNEYMQSIKEELELIEYTDKIIEQMNNNYPDLSDIEIALYLHDWITSHIDYQHVEDNQSTYNAIKNKKTACTGMSNTYKYLLTKCKIPCRIIQSSAINHAWNLITINNQYYVDCSPGSATYHYIQEYDREYFLISRENLYNKPGDHVTDWTYLDPSTPEEININVYETVETSSEYDDYDWSDYEFIFDDSIFDISYPKGTTIIPFNGYAVGSTDSKIVLFNNDKEYPTFELEDKATRYIHDISADGTTITYHTWLKDNPSESTAETHTLDWSEYFCGYCGKDGGENVTWSFLDGTLTLSGNGIMENIYDNGCPWRDFSDLITTVKISDSIDYIRYYTIYDTNLTDVYYDGTKTQWLSHGGFTYNEPIVTHFGKFDVIFKDKAGNTYKSQVINKDAKASYIDAPAVSDYTFKGWYEDPELTIPYDFDTEVNQDYTLYPKYVKSRVTVTFESNGGTAVNSISVEGESTINTPTNPTKNHCSFRAWCKDADLTQDFDFSTPITDDITLYADWTAVDAQITVTYLIRSNNTDTTYKTEKVFVGEAVSKPVDPPSQTNKIFKGWFNEPTLKTEFVFGNNAGNENITLYGAYCDRKNVMFNPNNGSSFYSIPVAKGFPVAEPETPVKNGFKFDGWYTDNNTFKNKYDFTTPITENISLYGKWSEKDSTEQKTLDVTMVVGGKETYPELAKSGTTYKIQNSAPTVASIATDGLVTGKKAGSSVVTISKKNLIYTVNITVINPRFSKTAYAVNKDDVFTTGFNANDLPIIWTSSNTSVATVDENGQITALSKGSAVITAKVQGKAYQTTVTVYNQSLSGANIVYIGSKAVTFKINGGYGTTTWTTSDSNIATVNSKGKVIGKTRGNVNIIAVNNGLTLTKTIYVCEVPKFKQKSVTINDGDTLDLDREWFDDSGIGGTTYTLNTVKYATIEENILTGTKKGSMKVTAHCAGRKYTMSVKVLTPTLTGVNTLYLGTKASTLKVKNGATKTTWSSSDDNVVTVTAKGAIKAISKGTATITAVNNGRVMTKEIAVYNIPKFNKLYVTNLDEPIDVTLIRDDDMPEPVYSVSKRTIATIDQTGRLTPVKTGKVFVTAKVLGKTYKTTVRIYDPMIRGSESVKVKKTTTLSVKGGYGKTVWSVDNPEIATISTKGVLKGIAPGTVEVTAVNNGREMKKTITVW